jgi:predicted alpha/beta superfamily hydrolase
VKPHAAAASLALILLLVVAGCGGQGWQSPAAATPSPTPSPTPAMRTADSFTFPSTIVGDSYQVHVAVPQQYETAADQRYPVLYLLDANWNYEGVRGLIDILVGQGRMEPVILVALCPVQALQPGYGGTAPSRCRDLTPTAHPGFPGSGGAAAFAGFLRGELVPHVDGRYRTRPTPDDRCLAGHSLAGLFAWYAGFELDDTFHKLIPASASLWWDDHVLLEAEARYALEHRDLPLHVYSTVSTGEGTDMVGDRDELVSRLRARSYVSLRLSTALYAGIPHEQSSSPAFREGLAELF